MMHSTSIRLIGIVALVAVMVDLGLANGQDRGTFSMPDSILLFANPDLELRIVSGPLVQEVKRSDSYGRFFPAALSPGGDRVAWAVPLGTHAAGAPSRFALAISPTKRQEWKPYGDFEEVGVAEFSPDGSKVAFVAKGYGVMVLDLVSGKTEATPKLPVTPLQTNIGWSPDGELLVMEVYRDGEMSQISTVNLDTGDVRVIGDGHAPSWSPTGQWVAYFDESWEKCIVVHPDGTGGRVVQNIGGHLFSSYRQFAFRAVWSPDGSQLLLNEMKGERGNVNVVLLNLTSGQVTRKSENGLIVLGWVRQNH